MAVFIGGLKGTKRSKPCWKGYEMIGMKRKGKRLVPNCVPIGNAPKPPKAIRKEIIDNRKNQEFSEGKWWAVVWFDNGRDMLMSFPTKSDAQWFITRGYKEFISEVMWESDFDND